MFCNRISVYHDHVSAGDMQQSYHVVWVHMHDIFSHKWQQHFFSFYTLEVISYH